MIGIHQFLLTKRKRKRKRGDEKKRRNRSVLQMPKEPNTFNKRSVSLLSNRGLRRTKRWWSGGNCDASESLMSCFRSLILYFSCGKCTSLVGLACVSDWWWRSLAEKKSATKSAITPKTRSRRIHAGHTRAIALLYLFWPLWSSSPLNFQPSRKQEVAHQGEQQVCPLAVTNYSGWWVKCDWGVVRWSDMMWCVL